MLITCFIIAIIYILVLRSDRKELRSKLASFGEWVDESAARNEKQHKQYMDLAKEHKSLEKRLAHMKEELRAAERNLQAYREYCGENAVQEEVVEDYSDVILRDLRKDMWRINNPVAAQAHAKAAREATLINAFGTRVFVDRNGRDRRYN